VATFLSLPLGYVFYFFQDHYYEPRFIFESAGALIIVCAMALFGLFSRIRETGALTRYLIVAAGLSLLIFIPCHLAKYRRAGDLGPELREIVAARGLRDSIIFIEPLHYPLGMMLQSPFIDGGNLFVRDLEGRQGEVLDLYPEKNAYRFHFDSASWNFRLDPFPGPRDPSTPTP
jgi:hypothetical protein